RSIDGVRILGRGTKIRPKDSGKVAGGVVIFGNVSENFKEPNSFYEYRTLYAIGGPQVLLGTRSHEPYKNMLTIPVGRANEKEDASNSSTAIRELSEEVKGIGNISLNNPSKTYIGYSDVLALNDARTNFTIYVTPIYS